jgi:hypothetical protein
MSLLEKCELREDKVAELKLDELKEPTTRDFVWLLCKLRFGGVCNDEEIEAITDIVFKAFQRSCEVK